MRIGCTRENEILLAAIDKLNKADPKFLLNQQLYRFGILFDRQGKS